eukprot:m.63140 g.63140  ORF g.63140 m.63140 type:complete len:429 (-) comp17758_c0_seq1:88-1374(-)
MSTIGYDEGGSEVAERPELASQALEAAVYNDPLNSWCADCSAADPDWASISLGTVLCIQCAGVHRSLPPEISKIKSLKLDKWTNAEIEVLRVVGNTLAKSIYDSRLSYTHKRVSFRTPMGLRQFILQEKYGGGPAVEDVAHPAAHNAAVQIAKMSTSLLADSPRRREGWLMKKGKDTDKWAPRWFELDFPTLTYWACDKKGDGKPEILGVPKETMRLTDTMVTLRSDRTFATKFGLQITYRKGDQDGDSNEFRNFFVSVESGEALTAWLNDIRTNKGLLLGLDKSMIGTPRGTAILAELSREVVREGWLQKTGPKGTGWKKRWVTLHDNRLLYYSSEFAAIAKGNIVINRECRVEPVPERVPHNHCFIVCTSQVGVGRSYLFQAETEATAASWVETIRSVCSNADLIVSPDATVPPEDSAAAVGVPSP